MSDTSHHRNDLPSHLWSDCDLCGLRHSSPDRCFYPLMRKCFGDLTEDQERFLRWMAAWDHWTVETFLSLLKLPKARAGSKV